MIINISWMQFQQHFLKTDKLVYVIENPESWCLYVNDNTMIIKSTVMKSEKPEENFAFVDRYINGMNIIKADYIVEHKPVKLRLIQDDV